MAKKQEQEDTRRIGSANQNHLNKGRSGLRDHLREMETEEIRVTPKKRREMAIARHSHTTYFH